MSYNESLISVIVSAIKLLYSLFILGNAQIHLFTQSTAETEQEEKKRTSLI